MLCCQPAISPSPWCLPGFSFLFIYGMSSEGDTTGGERAAVPSAEEAPFSAEQLAWIDRLIAARHTGPFVSPAPRLRPYVSPPPPPPPSLLANGCDQLVGLGAHGLLACLLGTGMPPSPTPQSSNPWIMPPARSGRGESLCKHAYGMARAMPRLTKPAVAPERRHLTSWHARHGIRRHGAITRHAHDLNSWYCTYGTRN